MRPGPGISTPRCRPSASGVSGPEHPDTLGTRSHLPFWVREAGDAAGARDQYAALLPVRERVLGPEHPNTRTRWPPATTSPGRPGRQGNAADARDQFATLLPITERVLGLEHPRTLVTRDNLARFTGEAGDGAGARDQYAALLSLRERVLGPERPGTLATRRSLAFWTNKAGGDAERGVN